ncbi:F0F1 ATP synthase subunit B [Marinicrinis lubricantis]|uniref:ATP synthase subunit b n=1 Tax=Marinicrinis lubricantis TaxID=2086470 RepID=A0ABW1IKD2_9BACL
MEFNLGSFLYAIVAFAILYFLLQRYAFGPLFSVMEKRREQVLGEMKNAEESRKQAEQYLAEQKQAIDEARKEALEIVEQARKTSVKQAEEIMARANEQSARMKEEALVEIESEKKRAVAELRSQVSAMSVMIASKIIEKQVDEKSQKELIDKYLKEVGNNL